MPPTVVCPLCDMKITSLICQEHDSSSNLVAIVPDNLPNYVALNKIFNKVLCIFSVKLCISDFEFILFTS